MIHEPLRPNHATGPTEPSPLDAGGGPRPTGERIVVLDAVRGLALFGILMVNAMLFFWPVQAIPLGMVPGGGPLDAAVDALVRFAFEGKYFTIFSLLFGIGVALQLSRGHPPGRIVRRLAILAVIGALHISFLWWGDILLHYAVLGLVLVMTRGWAARRLVRTAMVLIAVPIVLQLGLAALASLAATTPEGRAAFEAGEAGSVEGMQQVYAAAIAAYTGNDLAPMIARRWGDYAFSTFGTLLSGMLLIVVAMFLLGSAAMRSGWLEADAAPRWRALFIRVLPIALVANGVYAWGALTGAVYAFGSWPAAATTAAFVVGAPTGAMSIATGAALLLRRGGPLATGLAATGRMALSVYLTQSIVMTTLAYGYGLGLYGTVGHAGALAIAVVLFAVQVPLATAYARRFRFGPVEWLWRAATYGRRPT